METARPGPIRRGAIATRPPDRKEGVIYIVAIRKNATGEIRLCPQDGSWQPGDLERWTTGDLGCDSHLAATFAAAGGGNAPSEDASPTRTRFSALHVELDDDRRIPFDQPGGRLGTRTWDRPATSLAPTARTKPERKPRRPDPDLEATDGGPSPPAPGLIDSEA